MPFFLLGSFVAALLPALGFLGGFLTGPASAGFSTEGIEESLSERDSLARRWLLSLKPVQHESCFHQVPGEALNERQVQVFQSLANGPGCET